MVAMFILEMLNEKDEIIKRALVEKKKLVAGALNIPEQDYETVTEVCLPPAIPECTQTSGPPMKWLQRAACPRCSSHYC